MSKTNDTLIVISGKRKKLHHQISIHLRSLRKFTCKVTIGLLFTLLFVRCSDCADFSTPYHPFKSSVAKQKYLNFYDKEAGQWPVPAETLSVCGTYGKTFIRISGPADAPPMVLIPGGAVSSLIWAPMIGDLSKHFKVYALDNIYDYGRSVYERKMANEDDFLIWLDETFDSLGLASNVSLTGYSYGGWIVARYALHAPTRLNKIVLLAPACTVEPICAQFVIRVILCFTPIPYFKHSFSNWIFADLAKKNAISGIQEPEEDETSIALQSFKTKNAVLPPVLTDAELRSFKVPVLYMIGENEKTFSPVKSVSRMKKLIPKAEVRMIENAGHDLVLVRPDMVCKKIIEFSKKEN